MQAEDKPIHPQQHTSTHKTTAKSVVLLKVTDACNSIIWYYKKENTQTWHSKIKSVQIKQKLRIQAKRKGPTMAMPNGNSRNCKKHAAKKIALQSSLPLIEYHHDQEESLKQHGQGWKRELVRVILISSCQSRSCTCKHHSIHIHTDFAKIKLMSVCTHAVHPLPLSSSFLVSLNVQTKDLQRIFLILWFHFRI